MKEMKNKDSKPSILTDKEKAELISSIKEDVRGVLFSWVKKWWIRISTLVAIFGIIGYGFTLVGIYNMVKDHSTNFILYAITKKFAEPNIEDTFKKVAKNEAREMMKNEISPEIEDFKKEVRKALSEITSVSTESKEKIANQVESVEREVLFLRKRNSLTRLADKAMAIGERFSLEELYKVANDRSDQELSEAAISEILRVKNYYATMTRVGALKGEDVIYKGPLGVKYTYEEAPSDRLIKDLNKNSNWIVRLKAAEKLRNYKEKTVAEALLKSISNDPRLDVVKVSLESFEIITGYKSNDVFDYSPLGAVEKWWEENKNKISNLK